VGLTAFKKTDISREIFLFSILLYFAQGAFYPTGTIISQIALLTIISISIIFCIKVILSKSKKNISIWLWFLLFTLNILGFIFTFNYQNPYYFSQIKALLVFFLPFFSSYYLAKKGALEEKHFIRFLIIMLLISILNFQFAKEIILESRISDKTDLVNNTAYAFVVLIPYSLFFKRKLFSLLTIFIILLFIIQGAKRGAVIVGGLGALFFAYYMLKNIEKRHRLIGYLVAFVATASLSVFFYNYYMSNEFLLNRMAQISEGGSGRNIIYTNLLQAWYESGSIINYLFGHGFASTLQLSGTGNFAHNDWLELLTNFGFLGVFLYFSIFISFSRQALKSTNQRYKIMLLAVLTMWFLTTLFSMVYNNYSGIFYSILAGYLVASIHKHKLEERNVY